MAARPETLNPEPVKPIFTAHLFPKLEDKLIELLSSLSPDDWEKQTLAPKWKVKDVAAHLLDTQLRKLSLARDGYVAERANLTTDDGLVNFINRLNAGGVGLYRQLSPAVLIDLMRLASQQCIEYHQSLDPFADAMFPVSWAGESRSPNWFDTAREQTERWHHQQQIRLAVNKPGIMTPEFYYPVIDTFMRALPFGYRRISAAPGSMAQFNVAGDCGGQWFLYRDDRGWQLIAKPDGEKIAEATIPQDIAWRIFTKGIDRHSALGEIKAGGQQEIAHHIVNVIGIVG
jgi:uncharacterized protein (TIGR03083 family)